ncbi:hypothetical protein ACVXG8_20065 [Escherichia coli]
MSKRYESRALDTTIEGGTQLSNSKSTAKNTQIYLVVRKLLITPAPRMLLKFIPAACWLMLRGGTATNITQHDRSRFKSNDLRFDGERYE